MHARRRPRPGMGEFVSLSETNILGANDADSDFDRNVTELDLLPLVDLLGNESSSIKHEPGSQVPGTHLSDRDNHGSLPCAHRSQPRPEAPRAQDEARTEAVGWKPRAT
jgi:hypothetical protein